MESQLSGSAKPVPVNDGTMSVSSAQRATSVRAFLRSALVFLLVGLVLYGVVYFAAEQLVYKYALRNRFYAVKTAPLAKYDYVILGASHAGTFDYEDMNAQLEQMTGKKILNLSVVGSGITVNRLMLDYFLAGHQTDAIVYSVDSFLFYSPAWNEERLQDVRLFQRAPFDPVLVSILLSRPEGRAIALDYITGFSKINNPDRFSPDITDDEATRFDKVYRPIKQIDAQRLDYLYPSESDPAFYTRYLSEFEDLVRYTQEHNIRLIVIKTPLPERFYKMLPNEAKFDQDLKAILDKYQVEFHDYSLTDNDEKFFYNTDHLNRAGVLNFFRNSLVPLLK